MSILITGGAGFIGFHLIKALMANGHAVYSLDNLNDYYDVALKQRRLETLDTFAANEKHGSYQFFLMDLADKAAINKLFAQYSFEIVINLAAQAGVRYSLDNPQAYIDSNVQGFFNILEACRQFPVKHLLYASSSSVYGMNTHIPFSTTDRTDYPISLYAATKKSNELMAFSYSHLFGIPMTGLRFFTVYGEWGRPDMAYFKFTKAILENKPIDIYNYGDLKRDFTYIDDIVQGIINLLDKIPVKQANPYSNAQAAYQIYNLGNHQPVSLRRFITAIETACGKKAIERPLAMQAGDVPITYADISDSQQQFDFKPTVTIEDGIARFVQWYKAYYQPSD
jgi:UDP-glucuronate 4-epimerase